MQTMASTIDTAPNPEVTRMLEEAAKMTSEIRDLQAKIKERGLERRKVIIDLRGRKVTYRDIATKMGVTEQNVYKILNRPEF